MFRPSASGEREPDFFRTPKVVYATGLMFLAGRLHHLLDAEDDLGLVVVDSRCREDDQCADLIVAMTANAERGPGIGRGYLKKLLPRFAVHPATGELEGVGLKRFPELVPREHGHHRLFSVD